MRFAYLSCDFGVPLPGKAGSSVHLQETVDALRRLGHRVEVYAPNVGCDDTSRLPEDLHRVPLGGFAELATRFLELEKELVQPGHLAREFRAIIYSEYLQKSLLHTLAAFRPDVIYERYSLFAYAGVELSRQLGVPLLLESNAPLALEQAKYRQLALKRTAEELERLILSCADALFVVSTALADHARQLGVPSERIVVLPNGVNPERFHPAISGDDTRSCYGLHGKRVIGFVGTLKPWHDLDTVLEAVRLLVSTDERVHLLIVGRGPRLEQLQALLGDRITCLGAADHQQVPQLLAAMDVVVVPYASGGDSYFSPLKLFEAMAMGKPVVAARIGQVAEVVVHEETGLLYKAGDAEDLAEKVLHVFGMPDRGAHLGVAARQWVVDRRTWENNARKIVEVAKSLTSPASGPKSK